MSEETYLKALSKLMQADDALKARSNQFRTVSEAIEKNPARLVFANSGPPPATGATAYRTEIVDAAKWPDGTRLKKLFEEWGSARRALEAEWPSVPEGRRRLLVNPERAPGGGY